MGKALDAVLDFNNKAFDRVNRVTKGSIFDLASIANKPRAEGGNMPIDTGFLRDSQVGNLNEGDWTALAAALSGFVAGDRAGVGWTAEYAPFMEERYAFARLAAQEFPEIVKARLAKEV